VMAAYIYLSISIYLSIICIYISIYIFIYTYIAARAEDVGALVGRRGYGVYIYSSIYT